MDGRTLHEYRGGLVNYQFWSRNGDPPVPVRMGHHAYDGSFSQFSFVPFPVRRGAEQPASLPSALNFTVSQVTVPRKGFEIPDNVIVITSNASTSAAAMAANITVAVHPSAYYGAHAVISRTPHSLVMDAGELGTVTASFSKPMRPHPNPKCMDGNPSVPPYRFPCVVFDVTDRPLVITLSFSATQVQPSDAEAMVASGFGRVQAEIEAAGARAGGMTEAYDAMMTAVAWNVNFDPRVYVTCPVSRTFESNFDFIFFDWDMYFLSLMAGTFYMSRMHVHAYT